MKRGSVNRWDLPGWKFEPRYSSRTLVGDWFEEGRRFSRGEKMSFITECMAQFKACNSDYKSRDWRSMWNNRIMQQSGFGVNQLLDQHNLNYITRRLSTYNLEYSEPFRMQTKKYQPRRWDRQTYMWVPEKIDLPLTKDIKTLYDMIQKMKTNLRDVTKENKNKEKGFVFPNPITQDSCSSKLPKLSYTHYDKEKSRTINTVKH